MINWIKNYSKSTKKLNARNIRNFFVAWYRYLTSGSGWKKDQADWRKSLVEKNSPICLVTGSCVDCYCEFPEKLYESLACDKCYPKWMSKLEWIKFNIENDSI